MSQDFLNKIQAKLNYSFKNTELLQIALTHKSMRNAKNNERLEFLGDAVLDLIIGEFLYKKFPNHKEGDLSKMRASLVNEQSFASLGNALDLGQFIRISMAENNAGGKFKPSIISSAFEALIGAVYLDSDLANAKKITLKLLNQVFPNIDVKNLFQDYKTALQELTQAKFKSMPSYEILQESGPDHKKDFLIALFVNEREIARANSHSKKSAEQKCAKIAFELLRD
ncbi:MAG: ribonuclease III [Helicobacter sp.]|nr:ribonuclease III [Helicobacter sp.]